MTGHFRGRRIRSWLRPGLDPSSQVRLGLTQQYLLIRNRSSIIIKVAEAGNPDFVACISINDHRVAAHVRPLDKHLAIML